MTFFGGVYVELHRWGGSETFLATPPTIGVACEYVHVISDGRVASTEKSTNGNPMEIHL